MADPDIERLTARYDQLAGQPDGVSFIRGLRTYLDALETERRSKRVLKLLVRETEETSDDLRRRERKLVDEAIDIRDRLTAAAPEVDNSDEARPDIASGAYARWALNSFASFDELARKDVSLPFTPLPPFKNGADETALRTMLIILRGRLDEAQFPGQQRRAQEYRRNMRPELDDFGREIHNLEQKQGALIAEYVDRDHTLVGLAYERLNALRNVHEVEPFLIPEDADEEELVEAAFKRGLQTLSIGGIIRSAVHGVQLDQGERQMVDESVAFLRGEAERLHREVLHRIGRGEGEGRTRKTLRLVGRGSFRLWSLIVAALVAAVVGLLVAYAAEWLPGQGNDDSPDRTQPESPG